MFFIRLFERGLLPDFLMRPALRHRISSDLKKYYSLSVEKRHRYFNAFLQRLLLSPIAIHTDRANAQHYELPPEFFSLVLGRRMKYSACWWPEGVDTLDEAEERMLDLTCRRAGVADGMKILDLGCGWGSLTFHIAERYPGCTVLAVSNSGPQCAHIREKAAAGGLGNVDVLRADVNDFTTGRRFDRVLSVEMFEHVKNYEKLMEKIAGMLEEEGRLFVHMFSHREIAFEYTTGSRRNWMARNFFAGGNMPSADLLLYFPRHLRVVSSWRVSGLHYARTLRAWLRNFDRQRAEIRPLFARVYGEADARLWIARWRLFFIFCEVTFAYHGGNDYVVSHYLFEKNR